MRSKSQEQSRPMVTLAMLQDGRVQDSEFFPHSFLVKAFGTTDRLNLLYFKEENGVPQHQDHFAPPIRGYERGTFMSAHLGAGRRGQGSHEVREAGARGQDVVDGRGERRVPCRVAADAQDVPQILDLFTGGRSAVACCYRLVRQAS